MNSDLSADQLQKVTLKHVVSETGFHFIEKRTETPTSDVTIHSPEDCKADEIAVVFQGDHILCGLTEVYADRHPSLGSDKVHVYRYAGSYGDGVSVPDPTDKVANALEALRLLDEKDLRRLSRELFNDETCKVCGITMRFTPIVPMGEIKGPIMLPSDGEETT